MIRSNENRRLERVLGVARIDEGQIVRYLKTIDKSTIVSGSYSQRIHSKQEIQI